MARLRRAWWKRARRYRFETCGSVVRGTEAEATIRRYGCGRPVGVVWVAPDDLWHRMVTGKPLPPGIEPAGGILCIPCFDRLCLDRGYFPHWEPKPL